MKNFNSTITVKKQQLFFNRRSLLTILALLVFQVGALNATNSHGELLADSNPTPKEVMNSVFTDIINKMNIGHFFNATVTSLNEKKKGSKIDVFSSYGFTQVVDKVSNTNIELKEVSTSFSDRSHFSGSKTIEKIKLTDNGSSVKVEVTYVTWGNTRVNLTDVQIKKINQVYFITGYTTDGSNATYYTIALKDMGRLI